ncbi:hypothetical protein BZA70DRAFT_284829 [Myxozyma melibiosi]|uniref:Secreted protein n=1 Tax=Myxozyma melibiosi TaxID=54550 RepID=A0ABR1EYQ3_9ASCO
MPVVCCLVILLSLRYQNILFLIISLSILNHPMCNYSNHLHLLSELSYDLHPPLPTPQCPPYYNSCCSSPIVSCFIFILF